MAWQKSCMDGIVVLTKSFACILGGAGIEDSPCHAHPSETLSI